ncbi:MAG: hypothetical protein PHV34_21470 [Verrucomicrobiae bacterium]|nr:hypothetical protein [Verrucomicrobiae bacterium]
MHEKFPLPAFPKQRRWFPFYIGNGDLGMLLDPLGSNTLVGSKCRLELPLNWNGILIKDSNNQQVPHKKEQLKTRIDGMEHLVDIVEFDTIPGENYVCAIQLKGISANSPPLENTEKQQIVGMEIW